MDIPPGDDLFSHSVARAVSSALRRFTSVFGMGTGGAASLEPPGDTSARLVCTILHNPARVKQQKWATEFQASFPLWILRRVSSGFFEPIYSGILAGISGPKVRLSAP